MSFDQEKIAAFKMGDKPEVLDAVLKEIVDLVMDLIKLKF